MDWREVCSKSHNFCLLLFITFSILFSTDVLLSADPATAKEPKPSKSRRKFNQKRYEQRLLKGDFRSRMSAINTIRNGFLDEERATDLLVKTCDQLIENGTADTTMLLIVDTLRYSAPTPNSGEALVRWFDHAIANEAANPEAWQLMAYNALISMRESNHPSVLQRATELLRSEDYRIQMLAADIVGLQQHEPALEILVELVDSQAYSDHYGFRHATLEAISHFSGKKATRILEEQAAELGGQLGFLVGQRVVQRKKIVIETLRSPKQSKTARRKTTATRLASRAKKIEYDYVHGEDNPSPRKKKIRAPSYFYGQPIYANDVVFVIDVSSSMNQRAGTMTRLERAKYEAIRAINNLPEKSNFRVILFSNEVVDMMGTLVPASPANKARYTQRIQQLTSHHMTNLFGGLKTALMDFSEPEVIFLVSDGEPTTGEITNAADILVAMNNLNRFRRATINTISIGRSSPLLQRLSADHAGQFRKVR